MRPKKRKDPLARILVRIDKIITNITEFGAKILIGIEKIKTSILKTKVAEFFLDNNQAHFIENWFGKEWAPPIKIVVAFCSVLISCCGIVASVLTILAFAGINPLSPQITSPQVALSTKTPKPRSGGLGTFDSPFPLGTDAHLKHVDNGKETPYLFRVEEVYRGDDAIKKMDMKAGPTKDLIDSLPPEQEPIVIRIIVRNTSDHDILELRSPAFFIVTNGEVSGFYDDGLGLVQLLDGDNFITVSILPGKEKSAWMVRRVYKSDGKPLLATGQINDIRYGIYFSLNP